MPPSNTYSSTKSEGSNAQKDGDPKGWNTSYMLHTSRSSSVQPPQERIMAKPVVPRKYDQIVHRRYNSRGTAVEAQQQYS